MSAYTIEPVTIYRVEGNGRRRDCSTPELAAHQLADWEGIDAANVVIDAGGTLGAALAKMGRTCAPEIAGITNNHGIQIRHWQCTELYAYTIVRFDSTGNLHVGGIGGWSGYYGSTVQVHDLVRYPFRRGIQRDPRAK